MKQTVTIELFGKKFDIQVDEFDEHDAKDRAVARVRKSIKVVSVQPGWKEKEKPKDDVVDQMLGIFGMRR
jgi:uncharacterized protein YlxP (DUF503 family)